MEFSKELYQLIYGVDVDILELKKIKTFKEIYDDIILFLAKDDITKIKKIKEMNAIEVFSILNSKLINIPKIKEKITKVGYK
jgi:hypothetical protein